MAGLELHLNRAIRRRNPLRK